jgi:hypothetical protein
MINVTHTEKKVGELKLLDNNPRTIKDKDFQVLCDSLRANPELFEARACLVSDRTGELVIIGGNMRYRAAVEIGKKKIPVIIMSGLTEEKEREIIIRDNVQNGEWNWDMLANEWDMGELADFGLEIPNFNLQDPDEMDGAQNNSGAEEGAERGNVVQYNIIFNDTDEYNAWMAWIKQLKQGSPDDDRTISQLILAEIKKLQA